MKIVPHILLQEGDVIRIPWGNCDHIAIVVGLIEWELVVESYNNRFVLPWGFFLKDEWCYRPLIYTNASEKNFDNGST